MPLRYMPLRHSLLLMSALAVTACAAADTQMTQREVLKNTKQMRNASTHTAKISPIATYGNLSVKNGKIVGENGKAFSVAGPSFFWSNTGWGMDRFYNAGAVTTFAKDWNAGIVRGAIAGQGPGSYLNDAKGNTAKAVRLVDAAISNDIYVIVDWHSHRAEANVEEAKAFFTDMATRYGKTPNIIYEIYNEPLDKTDWATVVKPYAQDVIAAIRAIDPDNLIIVGTQTWAQDVDKALADPITGYDNIGYSLHYYAASHKAELRKKAEKAIKGGLPVMVTEWGSVTYDGDGDVDEKSSRKWLDMLRENGISHMMWAVSDKDEGSAMLKEGAPSKGGWKDKHLTESGKFARKVIREWEEK